MIHWDDVSEPDNLVWVERTMRLLLPKAAMQGSLEKEMEQAEDVDILAWAMVGRPYRCPSCAYTGIDTYGFPWGAERYARDGNPPRYCPHCDGGEDV
jgi:rubrerythrin